MIKTTMMDHCGYSNCIKLENEDTRVILGQHCGGRVLEYSWRKKNVLYLDPAHDGWVYKPGQPTVDISGGRFDIGPEQIIPPHTDLWLGGWTADSIAPGVARMTSAEDAATGTQLVREFELAENSSRLTCTQRIRNISGQPINWCHWSRTFAKGRGICIVPLSEHSRFPMGYVQYEGPDILNFAPQEPKVIRFSGCLIIDDAPRFPKLGMDSYAGWIGYLLQNDMLFVKRFETYPERVYNEIAGLTVSVWYPKDEMCEIEPIGPMETLLPGEIAQFTEEWWILPCPYHLPGSQKDVDEIFKLVAREAPVRQVD